jgi:hypothetical protein
MQTARKKQAVYTFKELKFVILPPAVLQQVLLLAFQGFVV